MINRLSKLWPTVCVPCAFPLYVSMFLYPSLFPVTDLTGMPLLSPGAKLRFPICDMCEDRGGLLHFKHNREAFGTLGAAAKATGYWDRKLPANGVLSVCIYSMCVLVCGWQGFKSLYSSCHCWHEKGNMRRVLYCGLWKKAGLLGIKYSPPVGLKGGD